MLRAAFLLIIMGIMVHPSHGQNRQAIERQFQDWLTKDLWPEAGREGISAAVYNTAFSGMTLNWKLPDLVVPGTKAEAARPQAQAEFRSPGVYFRENNLAPVVATG